MASRRPEPFALVKELGLLTGRGRAKSLLTLCHGGRLRGGLSISLRATPDEVFGPLLAALGPGAAGLKLLDVRTGTPPVLEVARGELHEKWEVEDVAALAHNLNDLFRADEGVAVAVVLGEWEDMLELWCLPKPALRRLLDARLLDDARNVATVRRLLEPDEPRDW